MTGQDRWPSYKKRQQSLRGSASFTGSQTVSLPSSLSSQRPGRGDRSRQKQPISTLGYFSQFCQSELKWKTYCGGGNKKGNTGSIASYLSNERQAWLPNEGLWTSSTPLPDHSSVSNASEEGMGPPRQRKKPLKDFVLSKDQNDSSLV